MEDKKIIDKIKMNRDLAGYLAGVFSSRGYKVELTSDESGVNLPYWARWIETGSSPTGTREQTAAIALTMMETGWNKRHGIDNPWPVAKSISERGTKTYRNGGDYFIDDAVSKWLDENLDTYILE